MAGANYVQTIREADTKTVSHSRERPGVPVQLDEASAPDTSRFKINFYSRINTPEEQCQVSIRDVIKIIRSNKHKDVCEKCRRETDKKRRDELKRYLPCVTFAGTFNHRAKDRLIEATGLATMDYDAYDGTGAAIKEKLHKDPYVFMAFLSPSGGCKAVIRIKKVKDATEYDQTYARLLERYSNLNPNTDSSNRDISRLCFLSHDPDIYVNENAEEFKWGWDESVEAARKRTLEAIKKEKQESTEKKKGTRDDSRSGREYRECCKLIGQGLSKKEVFKEMAAFQKWVQEKDNYRERTYQRAFDSVKLHINDDIIQLLDSPEVDYQYLDIGFKGGVMYYGFRLGGRDAVITSDKHILRDTLEVVKDVRGNTHTIGKNAIKTLIRYNGYVGSIAPTISRGSIKQFYTTDETPGKESVYNEVRSKILKYMDFGDRPEIVNVETCWIIATHIYPMFHWFPHILFTAPSESGKSKNATIMMYLSFRGYDLGASAGVTPAQIFRTLESNRGTILIDEFERMDKSESQILVNQILNASAARDAYVIRTEQIKRKWRAWKFPIFCPKIVANISGINPTSMSRFIGIPLLKTLDRQKGRLKPEAMKEKVTFPPLRDKISILMLQNWQEIQQIYDTLELTIINRDSDNWLPICSVAKWIGQDVYESVVSYIEQYQELKIQSNDLIESLFRTIYENVVDKPTYYTAKELADFMGEELSHQKSPASWVGWRMKQYYFKAERKERGKSYLLDKQSIKNILNRYFCTDKGSEDTIHTYDVIDTEDTCKKEKKHVPSEPPAVHQSENQGKKGTEKVKKLNIIQAIQSLDKGDGAHSDDIYKRMNCSKKDYLEYLQYAIKVGDVYPIRSMYYKVKP